MSAVYLRALLSGATVVGTFVVESLISHIILLGIYGYIAARIYNAPILAFVLPQPTRPLTTSTQPTSQKTSFNFLRIK